MKCPHCGRKIDAPTVARDLGRRGGEKSKRTITPEQQIRMQQARSINRSRRDRDAREQD